MPQALPFLAAVAAPAGYATFAYIATSVLVGVYQYDRAKAKARRARDALGSDSRSLTIRSAIAPRQIVLGTTRVPGILHYAEFVGSEEQYFDIVLVHAHNQLAAVQGVYVGQEYIAAANIVGQVPTAGTYATQATLTATEWFASATATITLANVPLNAAAVKVTANVGTPVDPISVELAVSTVVGNVVTLTAAPAGAVTVDYSYLSVAPLKLQWVLGTTSQAAMSWSGISTPKWGANHRCLGMAALRALHLAEHSLFVGGFPDISLLATGPVHVWDPRASGGAGAYIETGTSNPALLAAWYRTLPRADGGMGIPSTWIDWPSVATAANICDELVTVNKLDGSGTESIKRYECNTVLKLAGVSRADNLRIILSAMAGEFPFSGGLYRCYAGAYRAPTFTLTDEDVSGEEPLVFSPAVGGFKKPPNVLAGTIFDSAKLYAETGVPEVANATYITLDGAEELDELPLPATTDARQANYLMGTALERSRPRMAGQLTAGGKLRNATLLDTVQFNLTDYAELSGKVFEIRQWGNDFRGKHPVQLREVKASDWTLDPDTFTPVSQPTPPDLSYLLVVSDIAGLDAFSGDLERSMLHDGTVVNRIRVTWTQHSQAYVRDTGRIELRWKRASATAWIDEPSLPGSATSAYLLPVADGELYIIQVRAVNGRGAFCKWAQVLEVVSAVTGAQGSAGLVLVPHGVAGALLVRGRNVIKVGGTGAWDSAVRSETGIASACEVSFKSVSGGVMIGLNTDPATDAGYASIDYAVYVQNGSNAQIWESGALVAGTIAAAVGDVWAIRYTGSAVEYRQNGTLVRTVEAAIFQVFYLDSSFADPGSSAVEQLAFTPLTAVVPIGGGNLLANSSFEVDSDADGLADSLAGYSSGSTGTVTYTRITGGMQGGFMQRVTASNLGTSAGDQAGFRWVVELTGFEGAPFVFTAYADGGGAGTPDARLYIDFYDAAAGAGSVVGFATALLDSVPSGITRYMLTGIVPAGALSCRAYLWMQRRKTSSGTAILNFDHAQFEIGAAATAYAPKTDEILPGTVGTGQLGANAATKVLHGTDTATTTDVGAGLTYTVITLASYTPPVACTLSCFATFDADTTAGGWASTYGHYIQVEQPSGVGTVIGEIRTIPPARASQSVEFTVDVVAALAVTVKLIFTAPPGVTSHSYNKRLQAEFVMR